MLRGSTPITRVLQINRGHMRAVLLRPAAQAARARQLCHHYALTQRGRTHREWNASELSEVSWSDAIPNMRRRGMLGCSQPL